MTITIRYLEILEIKLLKSNSFIKPPPKKYLGIISNYFNKVNLIGNSDDVKDGGSTDIILLISS